MSRILTLSLVLLLGATAALAQQEMTLTRDGDVVVLTLPDGATETITVDGDAVVRILVRDGQVHVVRRPLERRARAFAMAPPEMEHFDDVEIELEDVFGRLPEIIRERMEGVVLPRVRVERDVPVELRREIAEAERESRRLALELRRAERDDRTAEAQRLRAELQRALDEAFDLHQEARAARLEAIRARQAQLEAEAADVAAEIEERQQRRAEIIERRRQELTRERDSLDW